MPRNDFINVDGTINYDNIASKPDLITNIKYNTPITLSKLPINANGTYGWNGVSFIQDNVTTYNNSQYAVFVGTDKNPYITKRILPNGEWQIFNLSTVSGNPLVSPTTDDGHNDYCLIVDTDGYIHVAGNHHVNALRYVRSVGTEDITSWVAPGMTSINEDQVTYPQFVKLRDGKLLFFYRNGTSGSGNVYINGYDTITKTWSKKQTLFIDGLSSSENAYLNHVAVDQFNTIHMMWVWRGTGLANTNNDICYAKSDDGGVTWKKSNGSTFALPITHATSEIIVDTAATDSGLMNTSGLEVDNQGRPHGAFLLYDDNNYTQINHVWYDGTRWYNDVATNFTHKYLTAVSIPDLSVARPSVFTTKNGRVYIIYRHRFNGNRNTIRLIDVTPGVTFYDDFPIMQLDLHDWEPTFDTQALYERNELHMLISPLKNNGSLSAEWNDADNWDRQHLSIVSYDLNQIYTIQRREAKIPCIRKLTTMIAPSSITVTATTRTDLAVPGLIVDKTLQGSLFAKLKARANLTDASGSTLLKFLIKDQDDGAALLVYYGTISVTSTGTQYYETPWIPLKTLPNSFGGFLSAAAFVDAGSGRFTLLEVELGILDF